MGWESFIAPALDFAGGFLANDSAMDRQKDQQAFNAEQAAQNRDWEERMSNTSVQRRVKDLQQAGINPLLAWTGGGASVPGAAPASSGIASPTPFHSMSAGLTNAAQAELLGVQKDQVAENINKTKAEIRNIDADTAVKQGTPAVQDATIRNINQSIEESQNRIQKIIQETETSAATATNLRQQTTNLAELVPKIRQEVQTLKAAAARDWSAAGLNKAETDEIRQRISANLPRLEAALMELDRQHKIITQPTTVMEHSVTGEGFIGALSATMKALNPFAGIMPTLPISGTGAPKPAEPQRKFPRSR